MTVEKQNGVNQALSRDFPLGSGNDKFGFGFQITDRKEKNTYMRSQGSCSWSGLYNTHFWIDPQKELAAVILMQVLPFYDDICMKTYQTFEELIYRNI